MGESLHSQVFALYAYPEAAVEEDTPTPVIGKPCEPVVGNLSGLKPGDILSPSVSFTDPEGNLVAPLSATWYINGVQTSSVIWDGEKASLELMYVCPDHGSYSRKFSVPAFTGSLPQENPQQPGGVTAQPGITITPETGPGSETQGNQPPASPAGSPGGVNPSGILIPVILAVGGLGLVAGVAGGVVILTAIPRGSGASAAAGCS